MEEQQEVKSMNDEAVEKFMELLQQEAESKKDEAVEKFIELMSGHSSYMNFIGRFNIIIARIDNDIAKHTKKINKLTAKKASYISTMESIIGKAKNIEIDLFDLIINK